MIKVPIPRRKAITIFNNLVKMKGAGPSPMQGIDIVPPLSKISRISSTPPQLGCKDIYIL